MPPVYYVIVAFPCTVGAIVLAMFHIYRHLLNYTEPTYQRYIVRIIFMVPVFALTSFLSLVMNKSSIYFDSIREVKVQKPPLFFGRLKNEEEAIHILSHLKASTPKIGTARTTLGCTWRPRHPSSERQGLSYEAWVIYNFLSLCLAWVGGPGAVASSLSGRSLKPSWCLMTCCFPAIPLDGRFIRRCKQGGLQFVILKPILVAITFILYAKGKYEDGNFSVDQAYLYITIIYTISYSMALYALALFYVACRDLLQPFSPVPKFLLIKSVVFLTYWQGVLVFLAAKSGFIKGANEAADFQNFVLCIEMLVAALGHLYAFPYKEYAGANIGASGGLTGSLAHALKFSDFCQDTIHQFAPTYLDYVLYNTSEGNEGSSKYRACTVVSAGQEMDTVRKNSQVNGGKLDDVQLSDVSCGSTIQAPAAGEGQRDPKAGHSLLKETSAAAVQPYDLALFAMDLSNYPTKVPAVDDSNKR